MTIKVSVCQEEPGNGNFVQVAIVQKDQYGNGHVHPGHISELVEGEKQDFYLYDGQELRVYETDQALKK